MIIAMLSTDAHMGLLNSEDKVPGMLLLRLSQDGEGTSCLFIRQSCGQLAR